MEPDGYAERLFKLWQRDSDGITLWETLEEGERQFKTHQPEYEDKELAYIRAGAPEGCQYLMDWYCELQGGEHLTYTEIKSWSELKNEPVEPWEVEALIQLDRLYHKVSYEHYRATSSQSHK